MRGLSYIVLSGLIVACGSQFTAGDGITSGSDASASGGNAGSAGGSAGSGLGGDAIAGSGGSSVDASATGGSAGVSTAGSGGAGVVDASPPIQCTIDSDCDDKNICNGIEVCRAGKCAPGAGMAC